MAYPRSKTSGTIKPVIGDYKMIQRILMAGLLGVCYSVSLSAGASDLTESFSVNEFSMDEFSLPEFNEYSVPVVLTASRIQQHQSDVPASVTILDAEFIQSTGADNVADVLKYVPGMVMGPDKSNNNDSVQYHGGIASFPKNLQVLINGRSMYRSGLAAVSWYELPIALEDIRRIEVVRGPNSATYGANAYQAVVNIISKHPADTYGTRFSIKSGNNGEENLYLSQGGRANEIDYRATYKQKSTDQFDVEGSDEFDNKDAHIFDVYADTLLGGSAELEVMFSAVDADRYVVEAGEFQSNEPLANESRLEFGSVFTKDFSSKNQLKVQFYSTKYEQKHNIDVEGQLAVVLDDELREMYLLNSKNTDEFVAAIVDQDTAALAVVLGNMTAAESVLANSIYNRYTNISDPGFIDPTVNVSGTIDAGLVEYRNDIEIQHSHIYSPQLTLVNGVSFRQDVVDSDHYLGGRLTNNTSRIFGSAQWKASEALDLHLGLMAEKESDLDTVFAPRFASIYKLNPSQSARFVYSQSVRSPDLFEQYADWKYLLENIETTETLNGNTFYQTQTGPGELEHQLIDSFELGYYGRLNALNTELDIRLFHEKLCDVIDQSQRLDDFKTYSQKKITYEGMEIQGQIEPFDDTLLRMTATYVDGDTNSEAVESAEDAQSRENVLLRVFVENSFTLSWLQNWGGLNSALHYYYTSNINPTAETSSYDIQRLDGQLSKVVGIGSLDANLALNFQYDLQDNAYLWGTHTYKDELRTQLSLGIEF